MVAVLSWIACFSSCIVCVCVYVCVLAIPVYVMFQKKTGTMRSGDSMVHGIPNIWNCCLFMNTLHNPLSLRRFWSGMTLSLLRHAGSSFYLALWATSTFWNVSVGSVPHCIRLIFPWQCRVNLPFTGVIWLVFFYALLFGVLNSQGDFCACSFIFLSFTFCEPQWYFEIISWRGVILY
jgi:hypothetical protein